MPQIGIKQGTTYYSECKSMASIINPVIDNNVRMQYSGFFKNLFSESNRTFDAWGYGLKKTRSNKGFIFSNDASKIFASDKGYVGMVLSFPHDIINGVYRFLGKGIQEYLLWGVNVDNFSVGFPSAYAKLTKDGIEFTIITSYGKSSVVNNISTIYANNNAFYEFIWDSLVLDDFSLPDFDATTVIRVNEEEIVASNYPIDVVDWTGLRFGVLDSAYGNYNLESTLGKLILGNEIPIGIQEEWYSSSSSEGYTSSSSSSSVGHSSSSSLSGTTSSSSSSSEGITSSSSSSSSSYGDSWTPVNGNVNCIKVAMSSNGKYQTAVSSTSQIYVSSDYGNSWNATGPIRQWRDIAMSSDGSIQVAVISENVTDRVYISYDSGATWNSSGSWPVGIGGIEGVAVSSNGTRITIVGFSTGVIYISINSGATWNLNSAGVFVISIAMSSTGQYQTAVVYGGQIYVSTTYGSTWNAKDSNRNWHSIAMSSDGSKQTATVSGGQIYVSTDSGNNWSAKDSNRGWASVAMSSDGSRQTAVVQTSGAIYVSTDSGNNWSAKPYYQSWYGIAMSSDGQYQTATVVSGKIYINHNYGH